MREIKFRAWDESLEQMIQLTGIREHTRVSDMFWVDYLEDADNVPVFKDHVMQFTGLKDENGVDIYEGDIIFLNYNRLGKRIVEFLNGKYNAADYCIAKCKVVGNIYENPELLKELEK